VAFCQCGGNVIDERSNTRFEYPYSLSYQLTSLIKLSLRAMPALASKMDALTKSDETTSSSVYPIIPFMGPSAAASTAATILISSLLVLFYVNITRDIIVTYIARKWFHRDPLCAHRKEYLCLQPIQTAKSPRSILLRRD
jgi:hypothetical protein